MKIAVVAHAGKSIGGGLSELRRVLEAQGVSDQVARRIARRSK